MPHLTENRPALESWTDCPAGNRAHDPARGPGLLRSGLVRLAHSLGQTLLPRGLGSSCGRSARAASDAGTDPGLSGRELPVAGLAGRTRRTADARLLGRPLHVISICQRCAVSQPIRVRLCRACRKRKQGGVMRQVGRVILTLAGAVLLLWLVLQAWIWALGHWGMGP